MELNQKDVGSVVVVELVGKVMGGPDATVLNDALHEFVQRGRKHVVVDLGQVTSMNSTGLGILISGLTTMRNTGGDLKLANVTERIQNLLMITKLRTVFEAFETVDKAVASFG
jgi:anti-sigma B factor antagonist